MTTVLADQFELDYRTVEETAKELYIRADRGVAYGRVVDAMSAAKLAGVTKMGMLTKTMDGPIKKGH